MCFSVSAASAPSCSSAPTTRAPWSDVGINEPEISSNCGPTCSTPQFSLKQTEARRKCKKRTAPTRGVRCQLAIRSEHTQIRVTRTPPGLQNRYSRVRFPPAPLAQLLGEPRLLIEGPISPRSAGGQETPQISPKFRKARYSRTRRADRAELVVTRSNSGERGETATVAQEVRCPCRAKLTERIIVRRMIGHDLRRIGRRRLGRCHVGRQRL